MEDFWTALADPAVAILVAGGAVTLIVQLLKLLWPWLANRATPAKKRLVAAVGALLAAVAVQAIAGKEFAGMDWAEILKVAAGAFFAATGAHTITVSSAYKDTPKEGEGA
jgi:hypothetical protein